jgi:hypothetical protein
MNIQINTLDNGRRRWAVLPVAAGFALALAGAPAFAQTAASTGCSSPQKTSEGDATVPKIPQKVSEGDATTPRIPQKASEGDATTPRIPQKASEGDATTPLVPQKAASVTPCRG